MDIQGSWLGYLEITKDWLTLAIAGFGVWVAWQGLQTWRRQLKGTSQFDTARKLMLKVYLLRQEISHCRAAFRRYKIETHDDDGNLIPSEEQYFYASKKDMWDRFDSVVRAYNEIELSLFESEIVISKDVRSIFIPIDDICYEVRSSIEEYLDLTDPKNKHSYNDKESHERRRELRKILFSRKGDETHIKIDEAVSAMETFLKPYLHE